MAGSCKVQKYPKLCATVGAQNKVGETTRQNKSGGSMHG